MVRKYKQKGQINYTEADLYNAVEAVNKGQLSQRAAADVYGVPRCTIQRWQKGRNCSQLGSGHKTVLSDEEEKLIVHALITIAEWGFGIDDQDLKDIISVYLKDDDRKFLFTDGRPGKDWMISFKKRHHAQLSCRKPEILQV